MTTALWLGLAWVSAAAGWVIGAYWVAGHEEERRELDDLFWQAKVREAYSRGVEEGIARARGEICPE